MKTINEVQESWKAEYRVERGWPTSAPVTNAELVDWLAQKRLLQQTPCSTLREVIEVRLNNAIQLRNCTKNKFRQVKHSEDIIKYQNLLELLNELQPVA